MEEVVRLHAPDAHLGGVPLRRLPAADRDPPARSRRLWESNRNKLVAGARRRHPVHRLSAGPRRAAARCCCRRDATTSRSWRCWARCSRSRAGSACAARWSARPSSTRPSWPSARARQRGRNDRRLGAADPAAAARQRAPRRAPRHIVVFFIFIVANARRPADAARRSAAVPRLSARRAVLVDLAAGARLGAGQRRAARAVRRRSTRSPSRASAASRAPARPSDPALEIGRSGSRAASTCSGCWASSASSSRPACSARAWPGSPAATLVAGGRDGAVRRPVVDDDRRARSAR